MSAQDDAWFEALAGRREADSTAAAEGALLRQALQAWPADVAMLEPREADLKALLARARPCAWCMRWRERLPSMWRPLLLAGAAALLIVTVLPPRVDAPEVERSAPGLVVRTDAEPARRRDALAADLEQAGARVQRYERLGRFGLDASLARPPSAAQQAVLDRERLVPGPDGSVQLEFEAPPP